MLAEVVLGIMKAIGYYGFVAHLKWRSVGPRCRCDSIIPPVRATCSRRPETTGARELARQT